MEAVQQAELLVNGQTRLDDLERQDALIKALQEEVSKRGMKMLEKARRGISERTIKRTKEEEVEG